MQSCEQKLMIYGYIKKGNQPYNNDNSHENKKLSTMQ